MSEHLSSSQFSDLKSEKEKKLSSYKNSGSCGKWTQEEMLKYVVFLDYYKETLNSKVKRRQFKAFKLMAQFLQTRNSIQCRSHHQKLLDKHRIIGKILTLYKSQFGKGTYKEQFNTLINSNPNIFKESQTLAFISSKKKSFTTQIAIQTDVKASDIVLRNEIEMPVYSQSPYGYFFNNSLMRLQYPYPQY